MGQDRWDDDDGRPWVDFGTTARAESHMKSRAQRTEYSNVDLATGYPRSQIWTTRDGRRIAIPNMTDSHLLNTIAYLRRRTEEYRKMQVIAIVREVYNFSLSAMLFEEWDMVSDQDIEVLKEQGREIFKLTPEAFRQKYLPLYGKMCNEAYKRGILIEQDEGMIEANNAKS